MPARDAVDQMLDAWARERPDLDLAAMGTFGRLGRLAHHATRAIDEVFGQHGLNTGEFDVLAALRRAGAPHALTPTALARTLMLSPGGMTNRLDRLEGSGLVRREADPDDRRSLQVVLTDEGLRTVDEAVTAHVANEERLLGPLTKAQRNALDDALRVLLRQFDQPAAD